MQTIRQIFEHAPASISVPEQWRQKRMEVILRLSEEAEPASCISHDWPVGYFEQTFGSIPDLPEREAQGVAEIREPLE